MKNENEIGVNYVFENDTAKQQERIVKAYARVINENRGVKIPRGAVNQYTNADGGLIEKFATTARKRYEKTLLGKSVAVEVDGNTLEVRFEKDGGKKSVAWRMDAQKAATFEYLEQLLKNAVYAYSEKNRTTLPPREIINGMSKRQRKNLYKRSAAYAPQYHYFVNYAEIDGQNIPIKIQVRDVNVKSGWETQYYTHGQVEIK